MKYISCLFIYIFAFYASSLFAIHDQLKRIQKEPRIKKTVYTRLAKAKKNKNDILLNAERERYNRDKGDKIF